MIRFAVDSVKLEGSCALVPGRVHKGTILVGSTFIKIDDNSISNSLELCVNRIIAYGRAISELSEGVTGELQLSGNGIEALYEIKPPFILEGME